MIMVKLYRVLRRWLGFGCRSEPWKGATRGFCCELSLGHETEHYSETENGPLYWTGEAPWYMPPQAPFVCAPVAKDFDLIITIPESRGIVYACCFRVHTEEEHADCPLRAIELATIGTQDK